MSDKPVVRPDSIDFHRPDAMKFSKDAAAAMLYRDLVLRERKDVHGLIGTTEHIGMLNAVIKDELWIEKVVQNTEVMLNEFRKMKTAGGRNKRIPLNDEGLMLANIASNPDVTLLGQPEQKQELPGGGATEENEPDDAKAYSSIYKALELQCEPGTRKTTEAEQVESEAPGTYFLVNPKHAKPELIEKLKDKKALNESLMESYTNMQACILKIHNNIVGDIVSAMFHLSELHNSVGALMLFNETIRDSIQRGVITPQAEQMGVFQFPVIERRIGQFQRVCCIIEEIYADLQKRMAKINRPNVIAEMSVLTGQYREQFGSTLEIS